MSLAAGPAAGPIYGPADGPAEGPGGPALGRAVVITCSTRAASGVYPDRAGPLIVEALQAWGFTADAPVVVPDGPPVGEALRTAIASGAAVVLTTGGTGLSPTDATPEQTAPLLDRLVPGIAEAIRAMNQRLGLPGGLAAMGVSADLFERIIDGAMADHCHKTNPRIATREDYRQMLDASM